MDGTREPVVAVLGAGPSGLFAAEQLGALGRRVVVFDRRRSPARTVLLAGRSGLNLTHDADVDRLLAAVDGGRPIDAALRAFGTEQLRAWADGLAADTFVGSSGRVFPAAMRGAPLVRAWLQRLRTLGVEVRTGHRWTGWVDGALSFETEVGSVTFEADATLLALGGASWPRVGSDGSWAEVLEWAGIAVAPLRPANCGVLVAWTAPMLERHEGTPIKNVRVSAAGRSATGDLMVTATGLEGTPVYTVASAIGADDGRSIELDLQPDRTPEGLAEHVAVKRRPKDSVSTWLRRVGLVPVVVDLLRDATGNRIPNEPAALAQLLKALPVRIEGIAPIDRAISSAGGVRLDEIDDDFMVRSRPGLFLAGEMLDWDAPTGGWLLQTCFSTGFTAAQGIDRHLAQG